MQSPDSQSRVLLVEGQDDKHVIDHIRSRCSMARKFCIRDKSNYVELLKSIPTEIKAPGRDVLGVVLDADEDPVARWHAVLTKLNALEEEGYFNISDLPNEPVPSGAVVEGRVRIGIWLMPDNCSCGELENFVEQMIPSSDPVWPKSQKYIDEIPICDRPFKTKKTTRAKVYAWLATRERPFRMGTAIRAQELDINVPLTVTFADWLRRLFN